MRRKSFWRLAVVASFGLGGVGATLTTSAPVGAKAHYTACTTLSGLDVAGHLDTLGGCAAPTGGSGTFTGPVASPLTITWAGGGTTTVSFTIKTFKKSHCGSAGSSQFFLRGHATASTGPASAIRGMFFAKICVDANEQLSVFPGKQVLLQS